MTNSKLPETAADLYGSAYLTIYGPRLLKNKGVIACCPYVPTAGSTAREVLTKAFDKLRDDIITEVERSAEHRPNVIIPTDLGAIHIGCALQFLSAGEHELIDRDFLYPKAIPSID